MSNSGLKTSVWNIKTHFLSCVRPLYGPAHVMDDVGVTLVLCFPFVSRLITYIGPTNLH